GSGTRCPRRVGPLRRTATARTEGASVRGSRRGRSFRAAARLLRIRWVRRFPNLNEFFVHHEDVRRANGLGPRTNLPEEDVALFRNVARARWLLSRRLRRVGLDLMWAGTDNVIRARGGPPTARVCGLPG